MPEAAWGIARYVAGAVTAIVGWQWVRTARSFVLVGIAVFLVTLFTGWWSTFAYLAAIAPIVCWHLDDWLDLGHLRVRWPGDPVGAWTAWIDRSLASAPTLGKDGPAGARGHRSGPCQVDSTGVVAVVWSKLRIGKR